MSLEGRQLGRYRLLHLLGSGGMGEVYLAEDTPINRQVAIKVIRAAAEAYPHTNVTKEAARLFLREIKAISALDHPHILPLYDYGDCGAIVFRANGPLRHYYYFRICQDGTFQLLLYTNSGLPAQTFASASSPTINVGLNQSNVIAAVAIGSSITIYVNHQPVYSMNDSTYSSGQIGVFADDDQNPTIVLFSNAKVWTF